MDELEAIEADWLVTWEEHLCFVRESRWCEAGSGAMSTDGGQGSQFRPRPLITFNGPLTVEGQQTGALASFWITCFVSFYVRVHFCCCNLSVGLQFG
jgi:hypothetical protein